MIDPLRLLDALDRPAALVGPDGQACGNPLFRALPVDAQAAVLAASPPEGWTAADLGGGVRMVIGEGEASGRLLAQERFLATLSHEIRTPLNGVLGMAGLLERTRLDATQKDYLAALRASGEHLIGLVNDVLDFAKLQSGHLELEVAPTDVERLLQGVCELLSPRAHAAGIEIAWAAEGQPAPVLADDGRLRQILFNLAGNAVKLTKDGGVLLSVEPRGFDGGRLRLRFCVRDTGPGLAPELHAKVFEEFVQTETGAQAGGAGLGLAIVKRLARAFDGELGVESEPGQGAVFWFEAAFEPAGPHAPARPLHGMGVGLISPSPIVRAAAARQIEACGAVPLLFETLEEAAGAPLGTVLLVDPPANSDLQAPPEGRPCLVLLAPEARDRIDPYRGAGYAGYLIKPLRRSSLAARVLAVLSKAEPATPTLANEDERAQPEAARGARVLLAEDNPVNAMLAKVLLEREGCLVERVGNGVEALTALSAAPYDLVLMDMRMPVMDGLEAARRLRVMGLKTPVVALTANAFDDDRRACLEVGMNDFLSKPIEPAALRTVLARWTSHLEGAKLAS